MIEQDDMIGHSAQELEDSTKEREVVRRDKGSGGKYKAKVSRDQADMVGFCLEDRIGENSVVRTIDFYVNTLDLDGLGFKSAKRAQSAGQPPYDPASLLKLYLYGYQNQVRSSRRLARACRVNIEVMWLMEEQTPEYRTINNFRSANSKALANTHARFIQLCRDLSLIGAERFSIDGSHFKGNVSAKSFITEKGLKKKRAAALAEAEEWIKALEEYEETEHEPEPDTVDVETLKKNLAQAQERAQQAEQQLQELEAAGKTQLSRTDPDARKLAKPGKALQGYNVQIATDHQHYLIAGDAVTNDPNDLHQLHPISRIIKERFGLDCIEVVADKGYYSGQALYDCLTDGITPYVPIPATRTLKQGDSRYPRSQFTYDEPRNVYICPAGSLLRPAGGPVQKPGQQKTQRYRNKKACAHCEQKSHCLTEKGTYRDIWGKEHDALEAEHAQRMKDNPEIYAERSAAVEHPFGTIKNRAGWGHFLLRGLEKVTGEWSLMALCYNFTRVLNILGMDEFKRVCEQIARAEAKDQFVEQIIGLPKAILSRFKAIKSKCRELAEKIWSLKTAWFAFVGAPAADLCPS